MMVDQEQPYPANSTTSTTNIELGPLTTSSTSRGLTQRSSSHLTASSSLVGDDHDNDDSQGSDSKGPTPTTTTTTLSPSERRQAMGMELLYGIIWFVLGWNIPRYLIHHETNIIHKLPPYQVVGNNNDVVLDFALNHPLVDPPTIPSDFLVWTSVQLPILFVAIVTYLLHHRESSSRNNDTSSSLLQWHKVCAATAGLLTAIAVSEGLTQLFKLCIQRKRPNYYALCEFDKITKQCTVSDINQLRDANFSFPSGHSSLAACSMVYCMWFCMGKVPLLLLSKSRNNNKSKARRAVHRLYWNLMLFLLFPGWALFVATSRVMDHWHHPSDILAGLCLGTSVATMVYHSWYPSPLNSQSTNPKIWLTSIPFTVSSTFNDGAVIRSNTTPTALGEGALTLV